MPMKQRAAVMIFCWKGESFSKMDIGEILWFKVHNTRFTVKKATSKHIVTKLHRWNLILFYYEYHKTSKI
jgi:hypothetical protein